jgi:hypothetical protein
VVDIDRAPAPVTDRMVMAVGVGVVASRRASAQVEFEGVPGGDQQGERAVDGSATDAGRDRAHPLVHLGGGRMIVRRPQHRQHGGALGSKAQLLI